MADPTSVITRNFKEDVDRASNIIKDEEALVIGALIALNVSTGKVEFMDDAANLLPLGVGVKQSAGDNENLTGNAAGDYSIVTRANMILKDVSVTGVSAITDVSKLVYATDGQLMTLTKPTDGLPIGFIKKWTTSTTCDVQLFSIEGIILRKRIEEIETIVEETQSICVGRIHSSALEGNSALDLFKWTAPFDGQIDSIFARCDKYDAGLIAGDQDINLEIGTTDLTGGVVSLGFGDGDASADLSAKVSGTAVTGNNIFSSGNEITGELVGGGTGFTASKEGWFSVWITITKTV